MKWIDYPWDVESYPNVFSAVFIHADSGMIWLFEVSDRLNQSRQFIQFVRTLAQFPQIRMVGFNSIGYDYPLLHHLMQFEYFTAADAYAKSKQIIDTPWDDRFKNTVRETQHHVKQVDLFKVWHFDNKARRTSLKQIEIALRMPHVADLPFPPGTWLTPDQLPALLGYNIHDVHATHWFWKESATALAFRDEMTADLGEDVTNQSDSNIGSKVFIKRMEERHPGICGRPGQWRQTPRSSINLAECVFPYVAFWHPEFMRIHDHFMNTTITHTKGVFDKLVANCYGLEFAFGTGGIHGAKDGHSWRATEKRVIQGRDVSSYYPNLAIKNTVFPEHLSSVFCDVYDDLYHLRKTFPKSNPRNKALKLALNGTYGNSNSKYSPFYDPKYTMTITINGQLLLCMLAEWLAGVPTLELIQVNTDGVEYAVDAEYVPMCDMLSERWEKLTKLSLDVENYSLFVQRDVNSYICVDVDGSVKCKGAFEYQHGVDGGKEGKRDGWHKNQSCKIIPMAAEQFIVNGVPIEQTVDSCDDAFLFMHTLKAQRSDTVMLGGQLVDYEDTASPLDAKGKHPMRKRHEGGVQQQRVGRFYIGKRGQDLFKIMQPLKKLPHHARPQAIEKGQPVCMCNDLFEFDWANLDRSYYIQKAEELVKGTGFYDL